MGSNRTFMELKFSKITINLRINSSNRTFMELKFSKITINLRINRF